MTPAELIPVLKALHANTTTAPIFADWFEERGDLTMAMFLRRRGASFAGWPGGGGFLIKGMINVDSVSCAAIRDAVGVDAFGQFQAACAASPEWRDAARVLIDHRLRGHHRLLGTRIQEWRRVDIGEGHPDRMAEFVVGVRRPVKERVRLEFCPLAVPINAITDLTGEASRVRVKAWVGHCRMTRQTLVSTVQDWQIGWHPWVPF